MSMQGLLFRWVPPTLVFSQPSPTSPHPLVCGMAQVLLPHGRLCELWGSPANRRPRWTAFVPPARPAPRKAPPKWRRPAPLTARRTAPAVGGWATATATATFGGHASTSRPVLHVPRDSCLSLVQVWVSHQGGEKWTVKFLPFFLQFSRFWGFFAVFFTAFFFTKKLHICSFFLQFLSFSFRET